MLDVIITYENSHLLLLLIIIIIEQENNEWRIVKD